MTHRANPIPETLTQVPGFPDTLRIYQIAASRYWQMRMFIAGKLVKRSTKSLHRSGAIIAAKDFYKELLLKSSQNIPLTEGSTFKKSAEALVKEVQATVERGERKPSLLKDTQRVVTKELVPFFGRDHVKSINYQRATDYVEHLQKKGMQSPTIKTHLVFLRQVLKQAHKLDYLDKIPIFPKISVKDNPREWFNEEQFKTLQKTIRQAIKDKIAMRHVPITEELLHLTNFMVNTFLRPQDIKLLQHKHITVVKKLDQSYLRIMAKGKTTPAAVISTKAAVSLYERFLKGNPDDFVFFPQYKRDHAMSVMSQQFKYCLEKADLYQTDGINRTLYSLRHTCIMNQLIKGKWSIHMLAKNCRTSVEMIERFYGSHLQAEMNVHQLHQQTEEGSTLEEFFEEA